MSEPAKSRYWRICKRAFRWFRIVLLLFILLAVILGIYLNQVGLPGFVKTTIISKLQDKGITLDFERLRFRWFEGLVAESVTIGSSNDPNGPQLTVDEASLKLKDGSVWSGDFQLDSIQLKGGHMVAPLIVSNQPTYQFTIKNLQTEIRLHADDAWELAELKGDCMGVKFHFAGAITNANYLSNWKRQRDTNQTAQAWQAQLSKVARTIERIEFIEPPELYLNISGDAKNTNDFAIDLTLAATRALTPWGTVDNLLLTTPIRPAPDNHILSQIKLSFDKAVTDQAILEASRINISLLQPLNDPIPTAIDIELNVKGLKTLYAGTGEIDFTAHNDRPTDPDEPLNTRLALSIQKFNAPLLLSRVGSVTLAAEVKHFATNAPPLSASAQLTVSNVVNAFGSANSLTLAANYSLAPKDRPVIADESWAWWARLEPYLLDWKLDLAGIKSIYPGKELELKKAALNGDWSAPRLKLSDVHVELYDGEVKLNAGVDVATRDAMADAYVHFTPHFIQHLLGPKGEKWIARYSFGAPPEIQVRSATGRLPEWPRWKGQQIDWRNEVVPVVKVDAHIKAIDGGYKDYMFDSAETDLSLSNAEWHFPNLEVRRPEGPAKVKFTSNALTKYYHWEVDAQLSAKAARHLLESEKQQAALDRFEFTQAPHIKGHVWGQWFHRENTGIDLRLALTNLTYRGIFADRARGRIQYTNRVVRVTEGEAWLDGRSVVAEGFGIHVSTNSEASRAWFTNVVGNVDPHLAAQAISPKTAASIEPFRWGTPPRIVLNGSIGIKNARTADMHFEVQSGPFTWWQLNFDKIGGGVHWTTNELRLSNIKADAYGGQLGGGGKFDFQRDRPGSQIQFHTDVTNANFAPLMKDLFQTTNEMTGVLSGSLTVDSAESGDFASWQGRGAVDLREGYLWSLPLFGFLSDALNEVVKGVGKSPITRGVGTFTMTNSIMHTRDLKLDSPAMRLHYRGSISHQGGVNAKVEAELFKKGNSLLKVIGLVATPFTKLMVLKVDGSITEPVLKPLYMPSFLLPFLQPKSTFQKIFTGPEPANSSAKPKKKPGPAKP
ncbi:MAG: hypothetical protein ACI8V5_002719 [Limisphaerales bacterium]|jgi:hypothetical protein